MHRNSGRSFIALLVAGLVIAPHSGAGQVVASHPFGFDDVIGLRQASAVAVSPDGHTVLYRVSYFEGTGPRKVEWHTIDASGDHERTLNLPEQFSPVGFIPTGAALYGVHRINAAQALAIVPLDSAMPVRVFALPFDIHDPIISPDGRRLYLADSYQSRVIRGDWRDVVSVYDARSGELLHDEVEISKRLLYKVFPNAHPYMFLSRDGTRLLVGKYGDPDIHLLRVAVLDSATFKPLAEWVQPNCWTLLPLLNGQLLCAGGMQPAIIDSMTGKASPIPGALPAQGAVALSSSRDRLYVVANAAGVETSVTVVDLAATPPRMLNERIGLQALQGFQVGYAQIATSPDESRLYIGVITGKNSYSGLPDQIWAYDTGTWTRAGVFEPRDQSFQFAVSGDGTQLYTVNPFKRSLSIFDTASFREIAVMHDLGETPAQVVVPPIQ